MRKSLIVGLLPSLVALAAADARADRARRAKQKPAVTPASFIASGAPPPNACARMPVLPRAERT
jgi:hypothetical protein